MKMRAGRRSRVAGYRRRPRRGRGYLEGTPRPADRPAPRTGTTPCLTLRGKTHGRISSLPAAQWSPRHGGDAMDVLIECCCGLDVHKATIVACLLKGEPHRKPHKEVR